jgi:hyperosmotically inducible periplasmic protein
MLKFNRSLFLLAFAFPFLVAALVPLPARAGGAPSFPDSRQNSQRQYNTEVALTREVRHVLVMQPFYTVFDNLEFKVNGEEVTLMGQVVNPALKSDAAAAVKKIEGVTSVKNEIQVLPPAPGDNRLRFALYRAIYSAPGFERYSTQAVPPIHIIVSLGHVTLVGVVANQMDKTLAITRANSVPGTVGRITDKLQIENSNR